MTDNDETTAPHLPENTAPPELEPQLDELCGLVDSWEEIYDEYRYGGSGDYDEAVLECARRLGTAPDGPLSYLWTLGLVLTAPFLTDLPGEGVPEAALEALRATDAALSARPCDHACHPYETHTDDWDEDLPGVLHELLDERAEWLQERPRSEWRCPRNVAGFARIARDIVDPGSAEGIPPRLPMQAQRDMASLSAVLELYPEAGTDPDEELSDQGWKLSYATDPEDRAGRIMVVRAVSWHAVSGMVRRKSVLDDLVEGLEKALTHYVPGPCAQHGDGHPALPDSGPAAAELGIRLSHATGRARYERDRRTPRDAPLETLLCPAFMAATAQETLELLRAGREALFGRRETAHLDAEYLGADGRLAIGTLAEHLRGTSRYEGRAADLGLWAARRHADAADDHERTALLLAACRSLQNAYPDPPPSVIDGVLPLLRSVATAPRPPECAHPDGHPPLLSGEFTHGLAHFYAPGTADVPAPERVHSAAAWACPRFAGEVAEAAVRHLDGMD